jgi:3-phosphoshikimate 1-carboxyvinyltransferase
MSNDIKNCIVSATTDVSGEISVDTDKSITHRAYMLASLSDGECLIKNPLRAQDCFNTLYSLKELGVKFEDNGDSIKIYGIGLNGYQSPAKDLYLGNSGTGFRLLAGLVAGSANVVAVLTGDESLTSRPMKRIIDPLRLMGADISARDDKYPPIKINGKKLNAIEYKLPMASAQVKSSILLAGLKSNGITKIHEPISSRDHTENMLKFLGVNIYKKKDIIYLEPPQKISSSQFSVPGDISSAAFFIVLGLLNPKNEKGLVIKNVGINPSRIGILDALKKMGAKLKILNKKSVSGELIADILVKKSKLKGIKISGKMIPLLIDEIPILTLTAIYAKGETFIEDAGELRYKETDRIKTIVEEFTKLGASIIERDDGFVVNPTGKLNANTVSSHKDHRIAMSLIIAGLVSENEITVEDVECIDTSFPNFFNILKNMGIKFSITNGKK